VRSIGNSAAIVRLRRARYAIRKQLTTKSCTIAKWRATVDEDGHYCFAVAL